MIDEQRIWPCPDEQMIVDYVLGSIDESAQLHLEMHLAQCRSCSQALRDWQDTLGTVPQDALPSDTLKRRLQKSLWTEPHHLQLSKRKKRRAISTVAGTAAVMMLVIAIYSNTSSENAAQLKDQLIVSNSKPMAGLEHIFADPNSELYSATSGELSSYFVVNKPEREMLVWLEGKPSAMSGDYQLWIIDEDETPVNGGIIVWSESAGVGYLRLQQLELARMKRLFISFVPEGVTDPPSDGLMTVELRP
ncbi:hypothetical protein [Marinicrinis lubricantis]|uniref:Anti-sigma factor n=1 Tax=Marinicrinis lubricantis TaxID=2086470 RepID=A0ABW1IR56_9BACL